MITIRHWFASMVQSNYRFENDRSSDEARQNTDCSMLDHCFQEIVLGDTISIFTLCEMMSALSTRLNLRSINVWGWILDPALNRIKPLFDALRQEVHPLLLHLILLLYLGVDQL